ncbi:hypothetical protein DOK78_002993 [Enterococcus sp. DIV2402]|uniref:Glycosyl transferase family 1 domain-containing protein n=1 Tax=Candidatus Enterococcus lowellii TaxID=2230877 RepID=A0ABZ2SV49_9ENTE|nr:glycosyltransferase [Enterococcus sp. DIV2402]MBO0465344.1 glycosyltransferase family 4 protein [Enterococcus sp. DIV2402]
MSNFLIVNEEHFVKDSNGDYWAKRIINDEYLSRYLEVFDEITVFARISRVEKANKKFKKITLSNVNFLEMPDFHGPKDLLKNSLNIIAQFKKGLSSNDGVILRAPSPLSLLLYRFIPPKKVMGVEFMMGADKFFEGNAFFTKIVNKIIINEAKKLVYKANGVSFVTKEHLQKIYIPRANNLNDSKYFTTSYSSIDLQPEFFSYRSEFNIHSSIKLIEVGYMDSLRKGQDILIETVSKLRQKKYDVELYLVGEGKQKEYFEKLAKEYSVENSVHFLGSISNKSQIRDLLIKSDIFVLPSKSEGLPRVLIEAMATGLPIVASNVDGIPELIQKELMVDDFSVEKYVQKITRLIDDTDYRKLISEENYKKAQIYEKSVLNKKRQEFYHKLNVLSNEN